MTTSLARPALVLLLAALTSACARNDDEQQKELAAMRVEIEQLTNALGRLEFRVYELENLQPTATVDEPANSSRNPNTNGAGATPAAEEAVAPEKSDRRFDLAPVE